MRLFTWRDDAWRSFAQEIGAEFVDRHNGGPGVRARVQDWTITLDSYWTHSRQSDHRYTRMRVPFVPKQELSFTLSNAGRSLSRLAGSGFLNTVLHLGGMLDGVLGQPISLGDAAFDDAFTLRADNEAAVRALFANQKIRRLIELQQNASGPIPFFRTPPDFWFQIPPSIDRAAVDLAQLRPVLASHLATPGPSRLSRVGVGGLTLLQMSVRGTVVDGKRLRAMYDLLTESVTELCRLGLAAEDPPPPDL